MKKVIMILGALCLLVLNTFAQTSQEVPAEVVKAFESKYSVVEFIEWDQEDNGKWEAEFEKDNLVFTAQFSEEGTWLKTSQTLSDMDLPDNVIAMLDTEMMDYEINEVELIETPTSKFYKLKVNSKGKEYKLNVDMDGKVIEKKMISEKKDGLK